MSPVQSSTCAILVGAAILGASLASSCSSSDGGGAGATGTTSTSASGSTSTSTSNGSGGSGGAGPLHDAGSDAPDGDGSPFSGPCVPPPSGCCTAYQAACTAAGGFYEFCHYFSCIEPKQCTPPLVPAPGKFACRSTSCNVGEVCEWQQPYADGCSTTGCEALPPACASTPTCACLMALSWHYLNSCSADADGNLTVAYN